MKPSSPKPYVTLLLGTLVAFFFFAVELNSAYAVQIDLNSIPPNAGSFEYFGLNFQSNVRTSDTVGTLDYTGQPGCGGICTATTQLGSSPSVFVTVNEVSFAATSGGSAQASLAYYVGYVNPTAGTYNVNLHATDSISLTSAQGSAYLALGPARTDGFFDFRSFQMADCVGTCNSINLAATVPFAPDHLVQMVANTLYRIELDVIINPGPAGTPNTISIDPIFTTDALGGQFIYSPGVFSAGSETPLPAALPLFAGGLGVMGLLARRRKRKAALAAV